MEIEERKELNKLWAELRVVQLLTAQLVAKRVSHDEIDDWVNGMTATYEDRTDVSYASQADMAEAYKRAGELLHKARNGFEPPAV